MKSIRIINVSKTFNQNDNFLDNESLILNNISFDIEPSSFVNILGPSGCGKTTLLNIIAGFIRPSTGQITFDDKLINGPSPERTVVFQEYGLFDWKTVRENIVFGLKAKGISKEEQKKIVRNYIELVHLCGSENKYPYELSGGMKQRAAIARALAVDPKCLLMDEPFGALDSQTRHLLQDEILEIWQRTSKTIISITHSVDEAVYLSDRIIVLSRSPARIILDINIDLPRPRYPEIRLEINFKKFYDTVWQVLRNEVLSNYNQNKCKGESNED
jgi:NitT/TauT family transport system ATP-binding protein